MKTIKQNFITSSWGYFFSILFLIKMPLKFYFKRGMQLVSEKNTKLYSNNSMHIV